MVAIISFAASVPLSNLTAAKVSELWVSRAATGTVNLNVQISADYLLTLYLIGTFIIVISVAASSWMIVRLKPKDIFTKMS